ncbi:MAG TPA: hypothetical protein VF432_18165 [Thermoanaerobaculia bacterium]
MSTNRRLWSVLVCVFFFASGAFAAPAKLSTITLNVSTIPGSNAVTGTATLTANAPNGGATVTLASSNTAAATVPATIVIPKGQISRTFAVTTYTVPSATNVTISGSYNGGNASAGLEVTEPRILSVTLSATDIVAVSGTATATVTLDADAPAGGELLDLSSSDSQQYRAAEPVVTSLTIPAGQRTATFGVVSRHQAWGNPFTTTVIVATNVPELGAWWGASLRVHPCVQQTAAPIVPPANEYVWIDDDVAPGMTVNQAYPYSWDTSQHASGTRSLHQDVQWTSEQPPSQLFYLQYATDKMVLRPNESLVVYVLVHKCAQPVWMLMDWRDVNSGTYKHATFGLQLSDYVYLGPVPATGEWTRVEIPASALGMPNGGLIDAFDSSSTYGMHWIDRLGKTCTEPAAPPIAIPSTDTVWIDDTLPAGATLGGSGSWDTAHKTSGTQSLATGGAAASGLHTVSVSGATATLQVDTGDKLVVNMLLNDCMPANEVLIRYHTVSGLTKTAWIGSYHGIEPPDAYYYGAIPAAGQWVRVEIPASNLGLEGQVIDGVQIDAFAGFAYFDAIGKTQ